MTEEYSRIGLTKVQKALDSKTGSGERKQWRINLARKKALVTMAFLLEISSLEAFSTHNAVASRVLSYSSARYSCIAPRRLRIVNQYIQEIHSGWVTSRVRKHKVFTASLGFESMLLANDVKPRKFPVAKIILALSIFAEVVFRAYSTVEGLSRDFAAVLCIYKVCLPALRFVYSYR